LTTVKSLEDKGLLEAIRFFSDPQTCVEAVANVRWPGGPFCPKCLRRRLSFLKTRLMWKCLDCKKQFSVKVGTIFEDSPVGLGVTQKTAWLMLQRIRYAMHHGTFNKMTGTVEADETFIGGKARNMHHDEKVRKIRGRGPEGKAIVFGLLERETGKVRASVVDFRRKWQLQNAIHDNVAKGAEIHTDALHSYDSLDNDYAHKVIDHAEAHVNGNVHTNRLENFWSLLKRSLGGTYISVEPFHLFRDLDEQSFRYNERKVISVF
jgi:transposase-like protein